MLSRDLVQRAARASKRTFVSPWQNTARAKNMAAGFFGIMGQGLLSFPLSYMMAGESIGQNLTYQILRMALIEFLVIPATFVILSRYPSRIFLALFQILSTLVFFIDPTSGFLNAIAISCVAGAFWVFFNTNIALNQNRSNHGNEVALSYYLMVVAAALGYFLGGLLLQEDRLTLAIVLGSAFNLIATMLIFTQLPKNDYLGSIKKLIGKDRPSTRITFLFAAMSTISDGCLPVWMRLVGMSPLSGGINMALRPILGMILTPVAGWMAQKGSLRSGQMAVLAIVVGWLLIAGATQIHWLLAFALGMITVGTNLIGPMEATRWFKRRSAPSIMAREIVLGLGRVPAYAIGLPIIFFFPFAFPVLGLAASALFFFGIRTSRKGIAHTPTTPLIP